MSAVNTGGARTGVARNTRTRYEIMMDFDELPEEYRRILRESPIQLELNPKNRRVCRDIRELDGTTGHQVVPRHLWVLSPSSFRYDVCEDAHQA